MRPARQTEDGQTTGRHLQDSDGHRDADPLPAPIERSSASPRSAAPALPLPDRHASDVLGAIVEPEIAQL
jgi:hypothetical protein